MSFGKFNKCVVWRQRGSLEAHRANHRALSRDTLCQTFGISAKLKIIVKYGLEFLTTS